MINLGGITRGEQRRLALDDSPKLGGDLVLNGHHILDGSVRNIGTTAYQDILDCPCVPTLDLKAYDSRNEATGVPSNVTFARASAGTRVNKFGLIESVADDVMRHDYDPVTGEYKGWLIEEARTNLLTYSEDFSNAAWLKARASIISNAVTAPDGTLTADKLIEDTTGDNTHVVYFNLSGLTANTIYTYSVFLKKDSRQSVSLMLRPDGSFDQSISATINLSSGVLIGTPATRSGASTILIDTKIEAFNNDWYRFSVTYSNPTAITLTVWNMLYNDTSYTYTGDGTSGIYIWGAQLEAGSFPTSYIKTTSAAVTRAADICTISNTDFTDFYNQSEGTIYCYGDGQRDGVLFDISDGTVNNTIQCRTHNTRVTAEGVTSILKSDLTIDDGDHVAMSLAANDYAHSQNGCPVCVDTTCTMPTVDKLSIGCRGSDNAKQLNGHIRQLTYFPKAVDDTTLKLLAQSETSCSTAARAGEEFLFDLVNGATFSGTLSITASMTVYWGDGTSTAYNGIDNIVSKTYTTAGNYTVSVVGKSYITKFVMSATGVNIKLALSDLPVNLTYFNCQGSNTVSGSLSDLPVNLTLFTCTGDSTVSGSLSDLPVNLTYFSCTGSNTISGSLSCLPVNLTLFSCQGSNTVSGSLSDLPVNITYFNCTGSNTISDYTSGRNWTNDMRKVYFIPVAPGGLSSTEIDSLLMNLANVSTWTSEKVVYLKGTNAARTSASDAAVATLQGKGVTVTTN